MRRRWFDVIAHPEPLFVGCGMVAASLLRLSWWLTKDR